jgi:hypothetical protein
MPWQGALAGAVVVVAGAVVDVVGELVEVDGVESVAEVFEVEPDDPHAVAATSSRTATTYVPLFALDRGLMNARLPRRAETYHPNSDSAPPTVTEDDRAMVT